MGEVVNLYGINIYTLGFFSVLSFLWGSFVFYKKSTEAHFEDNHILDLIVLAAFWGIVLGRVGFVITNLELFTKHWGRVLMISSYPGIERWSVVLGFVLPIWLGLSKRRMKLFDVLDMFALGYFAGASVFWSLLSILRFSWQSTLISLVYITSFVLLWRSEARYRFFAWYKATKNSARTGFVFGAAVFLSGFIYLLELVVSSGFKLNTYMLVGVLCLVIGVLIVYIRSGRLLADDIAIIKKWKKIKSK